MPSDYTVNSNGDYWQIRYVDDDGVVQRTGAGHKSKVSEAQARKMAISLCKDHAENPKAATRKGKMPFGMYTKRWLDIKSETLDPKTMLVHSCCMRRLVDQIGWDRQINSIRPHEATDFISWMRTKKNLSEATVSKYAKVAYSMFELALQEGFIRDNPFSHVERGYKKTRRLIEENIPEPVIEHLINELVNTDRLHLARVVALCYYAGLRTNEATTLRWNSVDLRNKLIDLVVEGKETNKKRRRIVPIIPGLDKYLFYFQEYDTPSGLVCHALKGKMPGDNSIARSIKRVLIQLGYEPFTLRDLRRTRSNIWASEQGLEMESICLGHSQATSKQSYQRMTPEDYARITGVKPTTKGDSNG